MMITVIIAAADTGVSCMPVSLQSPPINLFKMLYKNWRSILYPFVQMKK